MPQIEYDPDEEDKEVHCFTEPEESVVLRSQTVVKDGHVSAEKGDSDTNAEVLPFDMFQEPVNPI